MRDVAIVGIGGTRFGNYGDRSIRALGEEACIKAIRDAGMKPRDIQLAYAGNFAQWEWGQGLLIGHAVLRELGLTQIPITRVENGCATRSNAFREAWYKVATGACDIALAFGVEQMTVVGSEKILSVFMGRQHAERDGEMGNSAPGLFALLARRHMEEFGTTREQMAMVAVKNRKYGALNPEAQRTRAVTVEEVLNDRMICDPLTLSQCCPRGDGAAAVVLAAEGIARRYTSTPIRIAASVQVSGTYPDDRSYTFFDTDVRAAAAAYRMAGLGPEDIDLAEVHDCFSVAEIVHYEDLGFCSKGEGGRFVEEGSSEIGGKTPVNTSGGLLSKGHVIGATGISQIIELVRQLRGQAGERQVEGARVALQHNGGGFIHTDTASCFIHILRK
ncbi:MAG: thiolase domain-containing protein [Deltaproteobacteria bacterium]|nr:thiolase domain-containing protein [Deltaproteobacteria bacterium]